VPLVLLTSRRAVMGQFVNRRGTNWAASLVVALIVLLNGYLLVTTFTM
jgi:manganese transport protein